MTIQTGTVVLIVDQAGAYMGDGVYAERLRVVEVLGGGLLRVEDEDGVRRLLGREDVIRVEGAVRRRADTINRPGAFDGARPFTWEGMTMFENVEVIHSYTRRRPSRTACSSTFPPWHGRRAFATPSR